MLNSLFSAFLMYSRLPAPKVEWNEENHRYSLGFFPLIGAVIGTLLILWRYICTYLDFGQFLFAAGAVFLPVLITGGIHLDGFCDVCDARASYADREKRLEIMKDPHVGSFAVMNLCLYFIMQAALFSQVNSIKVSAVIACGYVISRALSAITAITFKSARSNSSLQSFILPAHRNVTLAMDIVLLIAGTAASVILLPITGITMFISSAAVLLYHRFASYRDFDGITGDLCGWFLQVCEIIMLAAAVFSERIMML